MKNNISVSGSHSSIPNNPNLDNLSREYESIKKSLTEISNKLTDKTLSVTALGKCVDALTSFFSHPLKNMGEKFAQLSSGFKEARFERYRSEELKLSPYNSLIVVFAYRLEQIAIEFEKSSQSETAQAKEIYEIAEKLGVLKVIIEFRKDYVELSEEIDQRLEKVIVQQMALDNGAGLDFNSESIQELFDSIEKIKALEQSYNDDTLPQSSQQEIKDKVQFSLVYLENTLEDLIRALYRAMRTEMREATQKGEKDALVLLKEETRIISKLLWSNGRKNELDQFLKLAKRIDKRLKESPGLENQAFSPAARLERRSSSLPVTASYWKRVITSENKPSEMAPWKKNLTHFLLTASQLFYPLIPAINSWIDQPAPSASNEPNDQRQPLNLKHQAESDQTLPFAAPLYLKGVAVYKRADESQLLSSSLFSLKWSKQTSSWVNHFSPESVYTAIPSQEVINNATMEGLSTLNKWQNSISTLQEEIQAKKDLVQNHEAIELLNNDLKAHSKQAESLQKTSPKNFGDVAEWIQSVEVLKSNLLQCQASMEAVRIDAAAAAQREQDFEALRMFISTPITSIDEKLLMHALGDVFGRDSGLEGADPIAVWKYRMLLFSRKLMVTSNPEERRLLNDLIASIKKAIELSPFNNPSFEKFVENVRQELNAQETNKAIPIIAGWQAGDSGHAVVIDILKQENGKYTVRLFDTSKNGNYQQRIQVGTQEKGVPFTEQSDVEAELLTSLPLLKHLWDMANKKPETLAFKEWTPRDFNRGFFDQLGGHFKAGYIHPDDIKTFYRSGVCSWMSFNALTNRFEKGDRTRIEFEQRFKMLSDFYKQYKDSFETNERRRNLFKKSLREFSQETAKAYLKQGVISPDELEYTRSILAPMEKTINLLDLRLEQKRMVEAPSGIVKLAESGIYPSVSTFDGLTAGVGVSHSNYDAFRLNYHFNSDTLIQDLNNITSDSKAKLKEGKGVVVAEELTRVIEEIVTSFPIKNDKKDTLKALANLGKIYAGALIAQGMQDPNWNGKVTPRQRIAQLKILAIVVNLTENKHRFRLPIALLSILEKNKLNYFRTYSPNLDDDIKFIRQTLSTWQNLSYYNTESLHQPTHFYSTGHPSDTSWKLNIFKLLNLQEIAESYYPNFKKSSWFSADNYIVLTNPVNDLDVDMALFADYFWLAEKKDDWNEFSLSNLLGLDDKRTFFWNPRNVLPEEFYDLRDLYILTMNIENYQEIRSTYPLDFDKPVQIQAVQREKDGVHTKWQLYPFIFGSEYRIRPHNSNEMLEETSKSFNKRIKDENLLYLYEQKNPYREGDEKDRRRLSPNAIIASNVAENVDLPLQKAREFLSIHSYPNQQVEKAMAYYRNNYFVLKNPDEKLMLELEIFDSGLLPKHIAEDSLSERMDFIGALGKFIADGIKEFEQVEMYEEVLFFLKLSRRVASYVHYAGWRGVAYDYYPTNKKAREIFEMKDIDPVLKTMAAREMALHYLYESKGTVDYEMALEMIEGVMYYHENPLPVDAFDPYADHEIDLLLHYFKEGFRHLVHVHKDKFLNDITQRLLPNEPDHLWISLGFPRFVNQKKTWQIDLFAGVLSFQSQGKKALPVSYIDQSFFGEFFEKNQNFDFVEYLDETYFLKDKQGNQYSFYERQFDHYRAIEVERHFTGSRYRWIKETDQFPIAFRQYHYWYSTDPSPHVILTDKDSKVPFVKMQLEVSSEGKFIINKVLGLDKECVLNDLELVAPSNTELFSFLSRIEDPDYILAWKNSKTGELARVDYPRLGTPSLQIDFKRENEGYRGYTRNLEGYFISDVQYAKIFSDFPHYLLLENQEGKKNVLVPALKITKGTEKALETEVSVERTATELLEFEMFSEKHFQPKTRSARLYLAYEELNKQNYAKAQEYLKGVSREFKTHPSRLQAMTPSEKKILTWIFESKDLDTRAIAIKARALHAFFENLIDFSKEAFEEFTEEFFLEEHGQLYLEYLNLIKNVEGFELEPHEEIHLASTLLQGGYSHYLIRARLDYLRNGNDASEIDTMVRSSLGLAWSYTSEQELGKEWETDVIRDEDNFRLQKRIPHDPNEAPIVTESQDIGVKSSTLRYFADYYDLVKDNLSYSMKAVVFASLTGYPLPKVYSNRQIRKDIEITLKMQFAAAPNQAEHWARRVLLAAFYYPEHFRVYKDGEINIKELKESLSKCNAQFLNQTERNISHLASSETFDRSISTPPKKLRKERLYPVDSSAKPSQQSVALYKSDAQKWVPAPNVTAHLEVTKMIKPGRLQQTRMRTELTKVFSISTGDTVADRLFTDTRQSIENYLTKDSGLFEEYSFVEETSIPDLKNVFDKEIQFSSKTLEEKENQIVALVNKNPSDSGKLALKELHLSSGQERLLSLHDTCMLFMRGDVDGFKWKNPELSGQEIAEISNQILEYLVLATIQQHRQRLVNKLKEIEDATDLDEKNELTQDFVAIASSKREYDPQKHPIYLVMEYYLNILLYDTQVEKLDLLQKNHGKLNNLHEIGTVLELKTGGGKTDVLTLLLGYLNADGESLSGVVMTDAVLSFVGDRYAQRAATAFEQEIQSLNFSRDDKTTKIRLQRLLDRMNRMIKDRQVLLMTNRTFMSLVAKFIEVLVIYNESQGVEVNDVYHLMRKIVQLMGNKMTLILDEIDEITNPLTEFHYTLENLRDEQDGSLEENKRKMIVSVYRLILNNPKFKMNMDCHQSENYPAFTPKHFESLQEVMIQELIDHQLFSEETDVKETISSWNEVEKKLVTDWLAKVKNPDAREFVLQQSENLRTVLSIVRGELNLILPLTFSRNVDEHFTTVPGKIIPVPSKGFGNPRPNSKPGTSYEEANYTIQYYMKKGIPQEFVEAEINALDKIFTREQHTNPQMAKMLSLAAKDPVNGVQRAAAISAAQAKLNKILGPGFDIRSVKKQLKRIIEFVNQSPDAKLNFIEKYILPDIKVNSYRISLGPQIYGWFFRKKVMGFSATPVREVLPPNMKMMPENEAAGWALSTLWKNKAEAVLTIPSIPPQNITQTPAERAEAIVGHLEKYVPYYDKYAGIIDMPALFRDVADNELVMNALLKNSEDEIKEGLFFDKDSKARVTSEKGNSFPAHLSRTHKNQKKYYFSQRETTGVDQPLPDAAEMMIFVGPLTTLQNLIQSVGRMRKLGNQKAKFIVPSDVDEVIRQTLKEIKVPVKGSLKLEHIFVFGAYNQGKGRGDLFYRSAKQQIMAVVHECFGEAIRDESISDQELASIFKEIQNVFVFDKKDDPWKMFGNENETMSGQEAIENEVSDFKSSDVVKALKKHPKAKNLQSVKTIEKNFDETEKRVKAIVPDTVDVAVSLGTQIEVFAEKDVQKDVQTEVQTDENDNSAGKKRILTESTEKERESNKLTEYHWYYEWYEDLVKGVGQFGNYINSDISELSNLKEFPDLYDTGYLLYRSRIKVRFYNFNEVMKMENADIFNKDFSVSSSLMPGGIARKERPPFNPFNEHQKPIDRILIVELPNDTRQIILIDQYDTEELRGRPFREADYTLISVADPTLVNRSFQASKKAGVYKRMPEVKEAIVTAKFFNGVSDYTQDELKVIGKWIREYGKERVRTLFEEKILRHKEVSRYEYENSVLYNFLSS